MAVGVRAPSGDAGNGPVGLVALHAREVGAEEQADLARDRLEDLGRRGSSRDQSCDPPQRGLLIRDLAELVATALERARHAVERPLQLADLRRPGLGHSHREIAAGEPLRHGGRAANGADDRAREVAGKEGNQQDRSSEPDDRRDHGAPSIHVVTLLA